MLTYTGRLISFGSVTELGRLASETGEGYNIILETNIGNVCGVAVVSSVLTTIFQYVGSICVVSKPECFIGVNISKKTISGDIMPTGNNVWYYYDIDTKTYYIKKLINGVFKRKPIIDIAKLQSYSDSDATYTATLTAGTLLRHRS